MNADMTDSPDGLGRRLGEVCFRTISSEPENGFADGKAEGLTATRQISQMPANLKLTKRHKAGSGWMLSRWGGQVLKAFDHGKHELGQFSVHVVIDAMFDRTLRRGVFTYRVHQAGDTAANSVDGVGRVQSPLGIETAQQQVLGQ